MAFQKTLLFIKQVSDGFSPSSKPFSGILRVETDGDTTDLYLSVVNSSALSGVEYSLFISDGKTFLLFPLGARPTNFKKTCDFCIENSLIFSAIVAVKDGIPVTVAFGKTEKSTVTLSDARKLVADKFLKERKTCPVQDLEQKIDHQPTQAYDDEAVATENYFELEESLNARLSALKEWNNADLRLENGDTTCANKEEKEEKPSDACQVQDETNANQRQEDSKRPFYLSVQTELNALFARFSLDERLNGLFPDSRWVKIPYSKDKYYIVGEIREKGQSKYICYGVPATYSPNPPKELKGYCSFIPLSIFDMHGEGFWMMFQSSLTGECVTGK